MKTQEEHASKMAREFNEIVASFKKGSLSPSETVMIGLQRLKFYLESSHNMFQTPSFLIEGLIGAFEKTRLGKERRILDRRYLEGCLIEGIIRFGAPKLQAYKFMFAYLGLAVSASKASHKIFINSYYSTASAATEVNEIFVDECCNWIVDFVAACKRKTPDSKAFPKADAAFSKLIESCNKIIESTKNNDYTAVQVCLGAFAMGR